MMQAIGAGRALHRRNEGRARLFGERGHVPAGDIGIWDAHEHQPAVVRQFQQFGVEAPKILDLVTGCEFTILTRHMDPF